MAAAAQLVMVTAPPEATAGQVLQITAPSGEQMFVAMPDGVSAGEQFRVQLETEVSPSGVVVQAQNNAFAEGAISAATPGLGGIVAQIAPTANTISNAVGNRTLKNKGSGVMVACSSCGAENETKLVMVSRAQFNCGQCGQLVLWRPRQVWLRDQGMPMEKPIHPQPGESDGAGCCVLLYM